MSGDSPYLDHGHSPAAWTGVGICMVGGVDAANKPENNYTEAQFKTLAELVGLLAARYKGAKVVGHRDFPGVAKACPCFDAQQWWASLNK